MGAIADIQARLAARGHMPGPIDGVWGRRTIAAVRAFQRAEGLAVDGVAGPDTLAALGLPGGAAPLPWLAEARRLMGVREAAGAASNPVILDWAGRAGIAYRGDDLPWCGLFVAHCVAATLPGEPLPADPLGARGWRRYGCASAAVTGAVLVFWRGSPGGWQGHVGFCVGEDADAFHVLGGNQDDRVSVARIARARLLAARWPATAAALPRGREIKADGGALSANEA